MKSRLRSQAGLSMLEIVVTMFLVLIGLLVVMTSFLAITKSQRYSERMQTANELARMQMERIRNMTFANVQSEVGAYNEYPQHPDYRHEVIVNDLGVVKEVVLNIYFENDRRRAQLRTYVSNL